MLQLEDANLLTRLVDIWGDVPVPLLRRLDLRRSLIRLHRYERSDYEPAASARYICPDRRKKGSTKASAGQTQFARPIYFLDIRTGYACGWCEIKDGQLTLIPHPNSGEQTRTFRYPNEVH
jgi:hypothetical protein